MNSKPFLKPRLAPLDAGARLEEFKLLEVGWLDGKGVPPPHGGLDWLAIAFDHHYADDLTPPYLYPTAEGQIRAEWSMPPRELSLEIDLLTRQAAWHAVNLANDAEELRTLNLEEAPAWTWLTEELRRLSEAHA
jgi:hypothetical protein